MRITLKRILKAAGLLCMAVAVVALNFATAPFQTVLPTHSITTYAEPVNLLEPSFSHRDGFSLRGWWRPHTPWTMTTNQTHTTLSNDCRLDAIHNIYQAVALPTKQFIVNSILSISASVSVQASFKLHPDQLIAVLTIDCQGDSPIVHDMPLRRYGSKSRANLIVELAVRQRWQGCLVMMALGCQQAYGQMTFVNPRLTVQENQRQRYFTSLPCPHWVNDDKKDTHGQLVTRTALAADEFHDSKLSLVTQLSMDRVQMLTLLRQHFQGPLHAAIFVPETEKTASWRVKFVKKHLTSLDKTQGPTDVLLAFPSITKAHDDVYPINALRNIAQSSVRSDWLLYLDADFVLSPNIQTALNAALAALPLATDLDKLALVVPAFESLASDRAAAKLPASKQELASMLRDKQVDTFRRRASPLSHAATDYDKFFTSSEASYPISYEDKFEPYVIVKRHPGLPSYPEAFVGYGLNKIAFTMTLSAAGYAFHVLNDAWCLHLPHMETKHAQSFLHDVHARIDNRRKRCSSVSGSVCVCARAGQVIVSSLLL
eukprot:TRINITY_DN11765_c0_g1_i4.p1 TRINITY_DN11765_c0_g1~~TRINITY_DN11765_c0_g1_i4.p1  ORF type:complete len:543 (+),score=93.67 TRINITY_DN11765_c0_g1_i4:1361-2989(+)